MYDFLEDKYQDLLKDGYLAWIIYDGFYSSGVMMDEIFDSYVDKF